MYKKSVKGRDKKLLYNVYEKMVRMTIQVASDITPSF